MPHIRIVLVALLLGASLGSAGARDVVRLPVPYMAQPDDETCLPTSLLMTLHFFGRAELTSDTVQALHKRTRYDRYNLPAIVAEYGLYAFPSWLEHAWTRETVEAELRAGRPVILGLDCTRAGHFVLAVGYTDDGKVIIHDPYWREPGWPFGGPYLTTSWEPLIWRNGCMVRGEPFPPARSVSGTLVDTTAPRTLVAGEAAIAEFAVRNNGKERWPEGVMLAAVDAYSSPTRERSSALAVLPGDARATSGTWLSASRVGRPDKVSVAPGEIAYFKVPLRAPAQLQDGKPVTFRENFNLIDAQGSWFSEHWQTGPSNRQIFFRLAVVPPTPPGFELPLLETAQGGRPMLPWKLKNGDAPHLGVATDATSVPSGAGAALRIAPPAEQDFQVAYVGDPLGTDYHVESWVYCDYRPQDKERGFSRSGVFMRDSGQHRLAPKTETESGEALAMSYDSDDGRIRMGTHAIGGMGDLGRRTTTTRIQQSGWHRFGIRATGTTVTYELDGIALTTASLHRGRDYDPDVSTGSLHRGDCGVFCFMAYPDEVDRRRGLVFAGFKVEK